MTTTNWRKAATGDFAKKGKWDNGIPNASTDAVIAAKGAKYTVKVVSADAAHSLTLNSDDATLREKVNGSLHVGTLSVEHGTAILTQANTIGSIVLAGGELDFSNAAALGAANISLAGGALFAATASAEISNNIALTLHQESVGVSNGDVLKLDGALMFNAASPTTLNFMGVESHGAGDGTGIIDLDGTISAANANSTLTLTNVTLASVASNASFSAFLSTMRIVKMEGASVLDLTGQSGVTLHDVQGVGVISNTGPHEDLSVLGEAGSGGYSGDFDLTFYDADLGSGPIALNAGDAIHVISGTDFFSTHFDTEDLTIDVSEGDASDPMLLFSNAVFDGVGIKIDLEATSGATASFHGATYSGTAPSFDFGTGQNNKLDIDLNYDGTISNFGGHNGGTDHIILDTGPRISGLQWKPNEAGTGGDLVVNYAHQPSFTLHLDGSYVQSDFKIDPEISSEIDCSAEQSSPHVPAHLVDALI